MGMGESGGTIKLPNNEARGTKNFIKASPVNDLTGLNQTLPCRRFIHLLETVLKQPFE
jgi:hypothetical protein